MKKVGVAKHINICVNCGILFPAVWFSTKYCGQKCGDSYRHKLNYKKRKTIDGQNKKCSFDGCDKMVWNFPRHIKANKLKFCNTTCMSGYMATSPMLICQVCKKEYYCSRSQRYLRNRKHCSRKCSGVARSIEAEIRNRDNPPTRGVLNRRIRYSKKMDDWRRAKYATSRGAIFRLTTLNHSPTLKS